MNNIVLGTMNIGYEYSSNQNNTNDYYKSIINEYIKLTDKSRILDTAYYYANTKTEKILGEILLDLEPIKLATKVNPWYNNDFTNGKLGQLSKSNIERQFNISLKNLNKDSVEVLFLHCPDYETPIIDTLEACNDIYRQEKINYFGISNYSLNQMKDILEICDNNKLIIPKYYQGMYNLISRKVEEIFPLLYDNNIEFWSYNPLAGGLLTGKYINNIINNSRFKNNSIYQNLFWKEPIINTFDCFFKSNNCCKYSLQWLNHKMHKIGKIILGVSTIEQLQENISYLSNNNFINDNNIDNKYNEIANITTNYYY
jgi:aflatoxin B1 aldehyde reductase